MKFKWTTLSALQRTLRMTKEAADTGAIAKKAASPNTTMKRRSADESSTATSTTRGPDAGSPRKSNSPPSCEEVKKEEAGVDENAAPSMLMKPEKRRRLGMTGLRRKVHSPMDSVKLSHRLQPMNGTNIRMPGEFKPYPNQNQMIIHTLRAMAGNGKDGRGQNAIIESPTGSGKTMGLLMPSCSWLAEFKEKRWEAERKCPVHGSGNLSVDQSYRTTQDEEASADEEGRAECDCGGRQRIQIYYSTRTHKQIAQVIQEYRRLMFGQDGTLKHTVLGSRENYCINPDVRSGPGSVDTKCKELCATKGGCSFKLQLNNRGFERHPDQLRDSIRRWAGESDVFDMEDLKGAMHSKQCCPYFASSYLAKDADVIFCPFPYLLYPRIRKGSPVNLKGAIVILDEAHNVEDACRDAASFQFDALEVAYALYDVKKKSGSGELCSDKWGSNPAGGDEEKEAKVMGDEIEFQLRSVERCVEGLRQLINKFREISITKPKKKLTEKTFTDLELGKHLESSKLLFDIGFEEELEKTLDWLTHPDGSFDILKNQRQGDVRLSSITLGCVEKYLAFLKFFRPEENRHFYRCHVKVEEQFGKETPFSRGQQDSSTVRQRVKAEFDGTLHKDPELANMLDCKELDTAVSLWCLSPSVAFRQAFGDARTVILASGTLSPIDSLKTELGMNFPIVYQGAQVIPKEQMFVRAVSHGPRGNELRCVFSNRKSPIYMAELVDTIAKICCTVKGGVLCFLPSYSMLHSLDQKRLREKLAGTKHLLVEPRSTQQLEGIFEEYKHAIEVPSTFGTECHGSLLLGVCRGKISEGIDFTDDFARCVITVGIPYPSLMDPLVKEKRNFNDLMRQQDSTVLPGEQWYRTEGFRALNQALGRCLRHRDDWGALILVDSRIAESARHHTEESKLISKWVQDVLKPQPHCDYTGFGDVIGELGKFCARMQLHKREAALEGRDYDGKTVESAKPAELA